MTEKEIIREKNLVRNYGREVARQIMDMEWMEELVTAYEREEQEMLEATYRELQEPKAGPTRNIGQGWEYVRDVTSMAQKLKVFQTLGMTEDEWSDMIERMWEDMDEKEYHNIFVNVKTRSVTLRPYIPPKRGDVIYYGDGYIGYNAPVNRAMPKDRFEYRVYQVLHSLS